MIRIGEVRVMMRDRSVRVLPAARQQRIEDCCPGPCRQYLGRIEIAPKAIDHPDEITLVERAQPSLPGDKPARLAPDLEARPKLAHQRHLLADREYHRFFDLSMP